MKWYAYHYLETYDDWERDLSRSLPAIFEHAEVNEDVCLASNTAQVRTLLSEPAPHYSLAIPCVKDIAEM